MSVFVEDIKFMQRTLKQELTDLESSERDLRRLFDENNPEFLMAEKLGFILEGLDKLKVSPFVYCLVYLILIEHCKSQV